MIRLLDAALLAHTKLQVHRVRTGVAIGVSGLLFGLIAAAIIITQGLFDSVDQFSKEGLNNRAITVISRSAQDAGFNEYDHLSDPEFVGAVEQHHAAMVAKKIAAAKKYAVAYDPLVEDPSPVTIDPSSKQKVIDDSRVQDQSVVAVGAERRRAEYTPFDIKAYLTPYASARVLTPYVNILPKDGGLTYMKDGKELLNPTESQRRQQSFGFIEENAPALVALNASLTDPFLANGRYTALREGEVPVVVPFADAERLLGYQKLTPHASVAEKVQRLNDVRSRIHEVTATYCYRNSASQSILSKAVAQKEDIARNSHVKEYQKPPLLYTLPAEESCGPIAIASDVRTAAEKRADENQLLYEKEIGRYTGEPVQQKLAVRAVGVAGDAMTAGSLSSLGGMMQMLLGSSLGGYNTWVVPSDALDTIPAAFRPSVDSDKQQFGNDERGYYWAESYLVEFDDFGEARTALARSGFSLLGGGGMVSDVSVYPFGSNTLLMDDMKHVVERFIWWALAIIGGIAVIILGSMIGRMVAEGRRESAIFRAIGAKRGDIGMMYGAYTLLLSVRVIIFAAILALVIASIAQLLWGDDATLEARFAYAATDITRQVSFISVNSLYLLYLCGVVVVASFLGAIIPIIAGARRNPIKDMRNDT